MGNAKNEESTFHIGRQRGAVDGWKQRPFGGKEVHSRADMRKRQTDFIYFKSGMVFVSVGVR